MPAFCTLEQAQAALGSEHVYDLSRVPFHPLGRMRTGDFRRVPFEAEALRGCRGTHVLMATLALSLNELRNDEVTKGLFFEENKAFASKSFARTIGGASWHLVRTGPVPGSLNQSRSEQEKLLAPHEMVVAVRMLAYTLLVLRLVNKKWPFEDMWLRTGQYDELGNARYVGVRGGTIRINGWSSGDIDPHLGLASECRTS